VRLIALVVSLTVTVEVTEAVIMMVPVTRVRNKISQMVMTMVCCI
jgi:hypothetical protein